MTNPASAPIPARHKFPTLDALRGVAAFSVVLFHYTGFMYNQKWEWPPSAYLAVDFFFLLSGFVIAFAYEERLRTGMSLKQFLILRLIRLYPLYWLGTTIAVMLTVLKSLHEGQPPALSLIPLAYPLNLAFLPVPPGLLPAHAFGVFPLNTPSWSLSLEMAVNIIFATACVRLTTARLKFIVAMAACLLLYSFWACNDSSLGWDWDRYPCGAARVLFSFFAGALLYRYFHAAPKKPLSPWWSPALALLLFSLFVFPHDGISFSILCCLVFFPLIVWGGAHAAVWPTMESFCSWAGRMSYVLYITHKPLLEAFVAAANHLGISPYIHPRASALLLTLCVLAVAVLLDRFYDVPMRSLLAQKVQPAKTEAPDFAAEAPERIS